MNRDSCWIVALDNPMQCDSQYHTAHGDRAQVNTFLIEVLKHNQQQ